MNKIRFVLGVISISLVGLVPNIIAQEESVDEPKFKKKVTGLFKGDYKYYPKDALYDGQHDEYFSSLFQPDIYIEWKKGKRLVQFTGFSRIDQHDVQRSHADIRELYYQAIFKKVEVSVGAKKIFWGVTESNHLVDVVNQLDVLEGFDVEQKLGQPMVHVSIDKKWGTLDILAMTYFRQMQFPGIEGRGRPDFGGIVPIITFESNMEEYSPNFAIRWSHNWKAFDFGVSHFYGTSRVPVFTITEDFDFIVLYELINQTGLEFQASHGAMIWKAEVIHRESKRKTITAATVGGEFTFGNVFMSGIDVGLIAEYNYDDRGAELISALNDDFFFGTRLAFNDRQSSDMIGGIILDRTNGTLRYFAKANRRLGSSWKMSFEISGFDNIDQDEFLYLLRNDGFMQFSLAKYF
ncbi:MAG: hypothetical protein HRT71_14140 [Flavobacteriales bacterium]|nr:hypothetical protein [Flavobacteriales bacterium]